MRKLGVISLLALVIALIPDVSSACAVCYGGVESPLTKGMNNGILVLLGVVGFVQIGFVALFWSFWRRARAIQKRRESFHVIQGLAK